MLEIAERFEKSRRAMVGHFYAPSFCCVYGECRGVCVSYSLPS